MKQEENNIPLGLGFSLAMNNQAMQTFSNMTDTEKKQVIEAARGVQSKAEMQHLVDSIASLDNMK